MQVLQGIIPTICILTIRSLNHVFSLSDGKTSSLFWGWLVQFCLPEFLLLLLQSWINCLKSVAEILRFSTRYIKLNEHWLCISLIAMLEMPNSCTRMMLMAQGASHYSCFKIKFPHSWLWDRSGNLTSQLHIWPQNRSCQNYSHLEVEGGGGRGNVNVVQCWSWIFCIICTAYLHTWVTLLKQDLAICPFYSQLTAIGSNMLKEACTRDQHGWKNGSLLPAYMQNNPPF